MSNASSKHRSARIDALKFFAIVLVVLSHVGNLPSYGHAIGQVVYVIRTINMPLFMLLAGYVLFGREGDDPLRFVGRKFMALMVPYFAWISIGLLRGHATLPEWLREFAAAALNPHESSRKWFLYVLFVFYILFVLVRLVNKRDVALILAAAGTVMLTFMPGADYLGRLNVQWLFTFFVAGYLAAKHLTKLPRPTLWTAFVAFAIYGVLLAIGVLPDAGNGWPPLYITSTGDLFYTHWASFATPVFVAWKYATAFAGIALVVVAYFLVDERWWAWQAAPGRRSLGIYVNQGWLLGLATGSSALWAFVGTVIVVYVAYAVTLLMEQTAFTRVLLLGHPIRPNHHAHPHGPDSTVPQLSTERPGATASLSPPPSEPKET